MQALLITADMGPATPADGSLEALALTWAALIDSPAGTVVVASHDHGLAWAMKTTEMLEVIEVPF